MSCELEGSVYMSDGSEVSYDGLPSTAFRVLMDKLPNTVFFIQKLSIPGVSIAPITYNTRVLDIDQIGEKPTYLPLVLTFLIDKDLKNFKEIYDWMMRIVVGQNQKDEEGDLILIINDRKTIRFTDCWPFDLTGMEFAANATQMEYLTASVSLHYDWFEFI